MTIFLTKMPEKNNSVELAKALELFSVGKKYALTAGLISKKVVGEDFWALKDVSLDVSSGEILGVVGRNGAGKTTLLNIISGIFSPTEGKIISKGRVLGLFNLGTGFQDEFTGRENIFLNGAVLGASRKELQDKLNKIIEFSELGTFIDMPLGTYSQGMRLRLGFSIIANLDFDILVIDEVLTVGDMLFQNKCFARLVDFRRQGKTLVITTQNLNLIERFCDHVALLEHGKLLFYGNTLEGINRYKSILNTDKFFVGLAQKKPLVENTKRWANDLLSWGSRLGTKEIIIESVKFINKFGRICCAIKTGDSLKIKVNFKVKDHLKDVHFGVAIFRIDGVYCYGPNTAFDGLKIYALSPGKGNFVLIYNKILLAPGEYRISIAIWDKNETLAFDYHVGYYKLTVVGNNNYSELLNIPYRIINAGRNHGFGLFRKIKKPILNLQSLSNKWEKSLAQKRIGPVILKLVNRSNEEKGTFTTNEAVNCVIDLGDSVCNNKNYYLWLALYRDDQICCQNIIYNIGKNPNIEVSFRKLLLLPGGYRISIAIWDNSLHEFVMYEHGIYKFKMVSQQEDHGTVFLEHNWRYRLPK